MSTRSIAIWVAAATSALALQPTPAFPQEPAFDLDTGNAPHDVVIPTALPPLRATVAASDASLVLHMTVQINNAWFDAIAPYHPTALGVASRLGRRPPSERATNRQRNIAMLYASYVVLNGLLPKYRAQWRDMLSKVGLDPDDPNRDPASPVGIGTRAGEAVLASRLHDGMNRLGDEGGRKYDRQPYADYLGYRPVNTADSLVDPRRWQPQVVTTGNGVFRVQEFVTPQYGVTRPYSYGSPKEFSLPPPRDSDPVKNPDGYRRQADELLRVSAGLTDVQKMTAEHFVDKYRSLPTTVAFLAEARRYTLDQYVFHAFLTNLAAFDAGIAAWHFKRLYDAVRPFSAIHYLYRGRTVAAWGGPGRGTVTDLPGEQWRSYLPTQDHPEYPSGSATFCAAHAEVSRRFTGTDSLGLSVTVRKGTSVVEPGVTPRTDIVLGPWHTWTQWAHDCALSRMWAGAHFRAAVTEGPALGTQIGDSVYVFVDRHIRGVVGALQ
jgi:hypothetical protein